MAFFFRESRTKQVSNFKIALTDGPAVTSFLARRMKSNRQTLEVVTASQVARRLDVSPSRILRAIHSGDLVPDGKAGRTFIFRAVRLHGLALTLGGRLDVARDLTS
jgi:hypothetical protein